MPPRTSPSRPPDRTSAARSASRSGRRTIPSRGRPAVRHSSTAMRSARCSQTRSSGQPPSDVPRSSHCSGRQASGSRGSCASSRRPCRRERSWRSAAACPTARARACSRSTRWCARWSATTSRRGLALRLADVDRGEQIADRVAIAIGAGGRGGPGEEIQWAFRRLLERVADDAPLVIALDDLHWAEPWLLDLVEYLAGFADGPIVIVAPARPELLEERPSWAGPEGPGQVAVLEPLSPAHTEELVTGLLADQSPPPGTARRMVQQSEGNPLFAEQVVAFAIEQSFASGAALPSTLRALLQERIDRLSEDERDVLARAAIEGSVFHREPLAALTSDDAASRDGATVLALMRKGFVSPHERGVRRWRRLPLPPRAPAQRGLRVRPEGAPGTAARALRRLARAARRRLGRDARPPPRRGVALRRRARRRPCAARRARAARRRAPRPGRRGSDRPQRRTGGGRALRSGSRDAADRLDRARRRPRRAGRRAAHGGPARGGRRGARRRRGRSTRAQATRPRAPTRACSGCRSRSRSTPPPRSRASRS